MYLPSPSSKSPLKWKPGAETIENPMTKRKRERPSVKEISKSFWPLGSSWKGVIDGTEQRDWPPRATLVAKAAEKGDILTLGNWKCFRLGSTRYQVGSRMWENKMKDWLNVSVSTEGQTSRHTSCRPMTGRLTSVGHSMFFSPPCFFLAGPSPLDVSSGWLLFIH